MRVYMNPVATGRPSRGGARMTRLGSRMSIALQLALGSGELKLQSPDPNDQPLLDYNYFQEPADLERMRDGVRTCIKLSQHEAWKDIIDSRIEPPDDGLDSDDDLDDWLLREVTTGHRIPLT